MKITAEDFDALFLYIRRMGKTLLKEDIVKKDTPHYGIVGNNCKYIYDQNLMAEIYAFRDPTDINVDTICFNHEKVYFCFSRHDVDNDGYYYVMPIFEHLFINAKNANKNLIMVIKK